MDPARRTLEEEGWEMEEGLAETRLGYEAKIQVGFLTEEVELLDMTFQDYQDMINLWSLDHDESQGKNDDRLEMKIFLVSSEFRAVHSSHHDF